MADHNCTISCIPDDLKKVMSSHESVFLLTDDNVCRCCLPIFRSLFGEDHALIGIQSGEEHKNIETLAHIWTTLTDNHASRDALLINLGGGVVSDIGGFAAACYNRGIAFVNVPTTLLSMIDASIGGKTGIDFMGVKNKIGLFADPELVYLNPDFLDTLPQRQLLSGLSEMVKYGFVSNSTFLGATEQNYRELLQQAASIKQNIVSHDKYDHGYRRILNFGHTIGHALEALFIGQKDTVLHGEAVAMGMFCSLFISHVRHNMPLSLLDAYVPTMKKLLAMCEARLTDDAIVQVPEKLIHDKKNIKAKPLFILLDSRLKCIFDDAVPHNDIIEALSKLKSVLDS